VRRIALHLLFSVTFSISQLVVDSAILSRLRIFPTFMTTFSGTLIVLLILGFHGNILAYWIVLGIQYALRYYRRYQEREKEALRLELHASALKSQLMQAQLSALKMQLQPHFLFNTLNAIMVLVRQERGPQAEKTLALLSDLLRCVLEDVEAQEVPLRRELEYLEIYLAIEQVRFQDRLRVEISAEPSALDAAVPHMGLQPIVENAVRHGIGRSSAAGRIEISAARVNGNLELRVQDDGPGLLSSDTPSRGIGLANTRARLQQLYGDGASLAVANGDQGGAVVTMTLPYHVAIEAADTEVMAVHAVDDADRR
jgi:sensor histidine kinase YesM